MSMPAMNKVFSTLKVRAEALIERNKQLEAWCGKLATSESMSPLELEGPCPNTHMFNQTRKIKNEISKQRKREKA